MNGILFILLNRTFPQITNIIKYFLVVVNPLNDIPPMFGLKTAYKNSRFLFENDYFWWAGVDSDHRSQVTTDLQIKIKLKNCDFI